MISFTSTAGGELRFITEYLLTSQFNRDAVYQNDLEQRSGLGGAIKAVGPVLLCVLEAERDRRPKRESEAISIERGCIN